MAMQPDSPFALLTRYVERVKAKPRELPGRKEALEYWIGIGFLLDGQHYVVAQDEVAEVLAPLEGTVVPGVKDWLLGIANVRGRLMALMDLRRFLGYEVPVTSHKNRYLVIDRAATYSGVRVDEVLGMQRFIKADMSAGPASTDAAILPYLCGSVIQDEITWNVFGLQRLATSPAFLTAGLET